MTPIDPAPLRRDLMRAASLAAVAPALPGLAAAQPAPPAAPAVLRVNGAPHDLAGLDPRTTLLDWLRETAGLTGAKKGCNEGACGACTVLLDGRRVNACLVLAATLDGREVTTVEGLARPDGRLHPVQQAFIDHDAFQCGYCTPGQVISAVAGIAEGHATDAATIREWMSGNICRCAAYTRITAAVQDAAARIARGEA